MSTIAVRVSRPPFELPSRASRAIEREIAAHVCRLIGDGATLQIGLGSLPDAVLESLTAKRDLGLHSGTIGDRVVELVEAGVITNRKKPVDTGKCVTATLLGSQRVYRWAHRNAQLEIRSPRYTHDILVHAMIPELIGINTALEVDLTGQMNAEVAGRSARRDGRRAMATSCAAASSRPAAAGSLSWSRPRATALSRASSRGSAEGSSRRRAATPTPSSPSTASPSCAAARCPSARDSSSRLRIPISAGSLSEAAEEELV